MPKTKDLIIQKAREIHATMTPAEKKGVRFGMFPMMKMAKLRVDGFSLGEEASVCSELVGLVSKEKLSPEDPFVKG